MSGQDSASISTLKRFCRAAPDYLAVEAADELGSDSDRAASIVLVAHLEDGLEQAIKCRMRRDLPVVAARELFEGDAPLAAFAAKYRMAFALGVFGPVIKGQFPAIQAIRNGFAHCRRPITFETPEVKNVAARLWATDLLLEDYRFESLPPHATTRERFMRAIYVLDLRIEADCKQRLTPEDRALLLP